MDFNRHSGFADRHAFLSPSYYHWLNYSDQKLEARFYTAVSARRGVDLHKLAHEAIRLGVRLAKVEKSLASYVTDAIKFHMVCEQLLYFSENCFGHADTIGFARNILRIHDLKTGISPTSMKQLEIYAALFCLEYGVNPFEIKIVLRIYQRDDIQIFEPEPEWIATVMEKIIDFDQKIETLKEADW